MSVTIDDTIQLGPTSFRVEYSSSLSDPTYYVYREGQLIETTTREWIQVELEPGEPLLIEILDSADITAQRGHPGRAVITFYSLDDADSYKIEKWNGSSWDTVQTILDTGQGFSQYTSDLLMDQVQHLFRVIPVSESGIDGNPREFDIPKLVRRPRVPDVTITYNDGAGTITVSEAS